MHFQAQASGQEKASFKPLKIFSIFSCFYGPKSCVLTKISIILPYTKVAMVMRNQQKPFYWPKPRNLQKGFLNENSIFMAGEEVLWASDRNDEWNFFSMLMLKTQSSPFVFSSKSHYSTIMMVFPAVPRWFFVAICKCLTRHPWNPRASQINQQVACWAPQKMILSTIYFRSCSEKWPCGQDTTLIPKIRIWVPINCNFPIKCWKLKTNILSLWNCEPIKNPPQTFREPLVVIFYHKKCHKDIIT